MRKILSLLNNHPLVDHFTFNSPTTGHSLQIYEFSITFINKSQLHVKEIQTLEARKYSYHWQDERSNLIVRWDTAPHHRHLSTFPHHKHDPEPTESFEITLEEVLDFIFKTMSSDDEKRVY